MARAASHDGVFQAIACPTRRRLIETLAVGESNVSDLVAALEVSQSAVSQQLAVLKNAGLVGERTEGRFRYYRLQAAPLSEVQIWLNRYQALMERRLDALGRVLDALPNEASPPAGRARQRSRKRR